MGHVDGGIFDGGFGLPVAFETGGPRAHVVEQFVLDGVFEDDRVEDPVEAGFEGLAGVVAKQWYGQRVAVLEEADNTVEGAVWPA